MYEEIKGRDEKPVRVIPRAEAPSPKRSAVVRNSKTWQETIHRLERGAPTVRIIVEISGLEKPVMAFATTLRRYVAKRWPGRFDVYVRNGIVYAARKDK